MAPALLVVAEVQRGHTTKVRRVYISTLFAVALALAVLGVTSLWYDIGWAGLISSNHWARIRLREGNVQVTYAKAGDVKSRSGVMMLMRGFFGVLSYRTGNSGRWRWMSGSVPLWMVVSLLFVEPAWAYFSGPVRNRRRSKRHQCESCGYSLQGVVSGRCSECGASFKEKTTSECSVNP